MTLKRNYSLETNIDIDDFNQNIIQKHIIDKLNKDKVSIWLKYGEQYCIESLNILVKKECDY